MKPDTPNEPTGQAVGALLSDAQVALLRRAVVIMTAILVAGVALLIGRVIYLANRPSAQGNAPAASISAIAEPRLLADARLALPAGSEIKHVSLTGGRLAVHHTHAGNDVISILDLTTGAVISRIVVERGK